MSSLLRSNVDRQIVWRCLSVGIEILSATLNACGFDMSARAQQKYRHLAAHKCCNLEWALSAVRFLVQCCLLHTCRQQHDAYQYTIWAPRFSFRRKLSHRLHTACAFTTYIKKSRELHWSVEDAWTDTRRCGVENEYAGGKRVGQISQKHSRSLHSNECLRIFPNKLLSAHSCSGLPRVE